MSNNTQVSKSAEASKCKLNNPELVAKVREWVRNLAMSGGKDWALQVPVNFEKDPDVLIEELCKRFERNQPNVPEPVGNVWVSEKPKFDKEFVLFTANNFRGNWEYSAWQVKQVESEDGWYYGLLTGDGEEWGDSDDLKADLYLSMQPLPQPPKH